MKKTPWVAAAAMLVLTGCTSTVARFHHQPAHLVNKLQPKPPAAAPVVQPAPMVLPQPAPVQQTPAPITAPKRRLKWLH